VTRRRILACIAVLTCLGLAVLTFLFMGEGRPWIDQGERIDEATFDRIEDGITQKEVEALLGQPPGDYKTQRIVEDFEYDLGWPRSHLEWRGNYGTIRVWFDKRERVCRKEFVGTHPLQPSFRDRLNRWYRKLVL
jgi:hypothetical protein